MDEVKDQAPEVDEYRRSLENLKAEHEVAARRAKQAMVGHCYRATERLQSDPSQTWPVYIAVLELDAKEHLTGWYFQHTPTGDVQIRLADDFHAGFLAEHCTQVSRNEFVAAFNEVLTHVARFASKIPAPQ
jgi:hypothetical protein